MRDRMRGPKKLWCKKIKKKNHKERGRLGKRQRREWEKSRKMD